MTAWYVRIEGLPKSFREWVPLTRPHRAIATVDATRPSAWVCCVTPVDNDVRVTIPAGYVGARVAAYRAPVPGIELLAYWDQSSVYPGDEYRLTPSTWEATPA